MLSPLVSHLYVAVRVIDPGLKRWRAMGRRFFVSHANNADYGDVRDASTVYAQWHSDPQWTLTVYLEATEWSNEFFVKIHTQPCHQLKEPRAGSYLTVLSPASNEKGRNAHYCCFVPPERLSIFQCQS